jgi:LmbE family N-acetylglucosaminyl deacetylase/CheY-like chemotaxis protein
MYENMTNADVVLVEDDPSTAAAARFLLEEYSSCRVRHFVRPSDALDALSAKGADIVLSDIRLPGMDGLEFVRRVRERGISTPIVLSTAYATVDVAIEAMRLGASGFIRKPLRRDDLLAELSRARADAQVRRAKRSVLAIGAHPDDVEIGVGGTLARHAADGDDISILTLSRGFVGGDPDRRAIEAQHAADVIGAKLVLGDLVDTKIEEAGRTVDLVEEVVARVQPDLVYTHSISDVHQDHRSAYRAVMVGARRVPNLYCFQSPSATVAFRPTRFIDIDQHVAGKLSLIAAHASQASTRGYLDEELITSTARYWGRFADAQHAEPLEVERERDRGEAQHAA